MSFPPSNRAHVPESAYLSPTGNVSDISLPSYLSDTVLQNRYRTPLIRLAIFEDVHNMIVRSRQLIFAVKEKPYKIGASHRITLLDDDRNLDHLIALHMQGRDLTGDFGETTENSPTLSDDILQDKGVVSAKQAAKATLSDVEEKWRVQVLLPLEQQYEVWKKGSGGGMFRRKSSMSGGTKVDYLELSDRAGPLLREIRDVHNEVEEQLKEVVGRHSEGLPRYEEKS